MCEHPHDPHKEEFSVILILNFYPLYIQFTYLNWFPEALGDTRQVKDPFYK